MKTERCKNRIFFGVFFLVLFSSLGYTWYRYTVALDFYVLLQSPCDPKTESCYISECDPTAEDAECSENPADDTYYYKTIKKKAYSAQACVNTSGDCEQQASCTPGEKHCTVIWCDISQEESGGACYGPGLIIPEKSPDPVSEESTPENIVEDSSAQGEEVSSTIEEIPENPAGSDGERFGV